MEINGFLYFYKSLQKNKHVIKTSILGYKYKKSVNLD